MNGDNETQGDRIRKMRAEQEMMILEADLSASRRKIESAQMDLRVLERKESDLRAQREEVESTLKKLEENQRLREEEHRALKKKIQTMMG